MAGSDITLTSGVRTNLLSLQKAASQTADVNNRLATGKKVNSALDNPTNFFTAASLVSRSSDLSNLLDSMSNGIQTIQAADNGLSSITDTLESMQSTLRQARQDKSFENASLDLTAFRAGTGFTSTQALTLSGGAFGTTGTGSIALTKSVTTGATATTFAGVDAVATASAGTPSAAVLTTGNFGSPLTFDNVGDQLNFSIEIDGSGTVTPVTIDQDTLTAAGITGGTIDDVNELAAAVTQALDDASVTGVTVGTSGTALTFTSGTTGPSSEVAITLAAAVDGGGTNTLTNTSGIANDTENGAAAVPTTGVAGGTISINGSADITIAADASAADIKTAIDNANIAGLTVTNNAGTLSFSLASGEDLEIEGSDTQILQDIGLTNSAVSTVTSANGTTGTTTTQAKTVDEIVNSVNNDTALKGKIKASNDNGKLRLQNLSTQELSIDGVTEDGVVDATSTDEMSVAGNSVRGDLAKQFNDLRDQLDKYADDASFNGINLLRGDLLKLTFNETGTSTIDIQTDDGESVDSASLGIETIEEQDLDSDATIDAQLDVLGSALKEIRSVSSSFGSNLSVVENRQSFTKEMMNTLQTGADNLTLADSNEEGANLMALQTRSQLATTALSFAVQADQTVLRFLG